MALNFWRFFKTHTLTHTGKGAESTGQGQTENFLSGPVFFCHIYRICWLMTPPMVSAGFTLNTYTHATAQMKQDAADTIGGVISQQMR